MIRPFTIISMVLACGSGLYLYQSKHQAQMLDREITRTVKLTDAARDRIGMLRTEWALLNEPDRIAELAKAHTALQPLKPTQFVAMTELASKLPPPGQYPPQPEPEDIPVAQAAPAAPVQTASAAPEPRPEIKPEPKPEPHIAAAEPKPKPEPKPRPARPAVVELAAAATPAYRPVSHAAQAPAVNPDATAPGTVGAAVLRAMRAQASPAPEQYAAPAYTRPAYQQPQSYAAPQAYASPAASMLGSSRGALPPPVPYASR